MKNLALALAAALIMGGCSKDDPVTPTGPGNIIINNNNTNTNGGQAGGGQGSGGGSGSCPTVIRVGVVATLNGGIVSQWRVGEVPRLDATPKGDDNRPVPSVCHGTTVFWSLSGTATCRLGGDLQGFIPDLVCSAPGSIAATASVSAPGGTGTSSFEVRQ